MAQKSCSKRSTFESIDIYDLYNKLQQPSNIIVIDIRPKEDYRRIHSNHCINIPCTFSDNEIIQTFKNNFFFDTIFFCANQQQIEKNEDIDFYIKLHLIWLNKLNEKEYISFILNVDINKFFKRFPFLCVKNDILVQNVIQTYYQRINNYSTYPNQIINDQLFLGTFEQAENKEILNNLQITHMINVTSKNYNDKTIINNRKYLQVFVGDYVKAEINQYFEQTFKFIHDALKNNKVTSSNYNEEKKDNQYILKKNRVFVHCKHGISRSSTIVISYLMKERKMKFCEALTFVKNKREVIQPNIGFIKQLKCFEKNNYCVVNEFDVKYV
eukprot:142200_1